MKPLAALALAAGCLLGTAALRAQGRDSLPLGARVRVVAPPQLLPPTIGTVLAQRADSLVLRIPPGDFVSVPVRSIRQLEISRGRSSRAGTGALVGLAIGTTATAIFLTGFCSDTDTNCQADEIVRAFAILGGPPTLLGALIGSASHGERWERVPVARLSFGGGRFAMRFTYSF